MIRALPLLAALALAACGPRAAPEPPATPEPAAASALEGAFSATSTTAMGITGDLVATDASLAFDKGMTLITRPAGPVDFTTPLRKGGDSFGETLLAPSGSALELREVSDVIRAAVRTQSVCGPVRPTYVALAYGAPAETVRMAVFSGADAPGPAAEDTALCGTFMYDKE